MMDRLLWSVCGMKSLWLRVDAAAGNGYGFEFKSPKGGGRLIAQGKRVRRAQPWVMPKVGIAP